MNILFFGPFNYRARDNESLMIRFKQMGHHIYFLTMSEGSEIIPVLEARGIKCYRLGIKGSSKFNILRQIVFLIGFIRKRKIQIVFSHLEPANLISVLTQFCSRAKFFIVRHHSNDLILLGKHKQLSYRLTYKLAKQIIVVSRFAKKVMCETEGINPKKIHVIPLSFDFSLFPEPNILTTSAIKNQYQADLLILCAGRLVANKRFDQAIKVAFFLKQKGTNFKMLIVGEGPLFDQLNQEIKKSKLDEHCFVLGYRSNMMDYIEACDILLHPSISESSSMIVKEGGLRKKAVVACKGVGDFDEVVLNGVNGILFDQASFVDDSVNFIYSNQFNKERLQSMGEKLHHSIINKFNVDRNLSYYEPHLK